MAAIDVTPIGSAEFQVEVTDDQGTSEHRVTVPAGYPAELGVAGGVSLADLVRESFRFLLEREPKEQILRTFELDVIERYFPEYRERIGDRVAGG
jgi:hypothetical protein